MEKEFQHNDEQSKTQIEGDNVKGDKYEAEKIEFNDYFEKLEATTCPTCQERFDENTTRQGKKIICGNCESISYDFNFEKSLALEYPKVPASQHDEFKRLRSLVLNYIKLERYEDAFQQSEKLIENCPDAPHSYLFNALCMYLRRNKLEVINDSARETIKRLDIAKFEFDEDDEKEDLENITRDIAHHYFYLLQNAIYNINELYLKSKNVDKKNFYGYFFRHVNELFTCYNIYPNPDFLKLAIEHLYGYHGFAWYIFKPKNPKYSDLSQVLSSKKYDVIPKHKKVPALVESVKKSLKKIDSLNLIPERKIDFSNVTGKETPETIDSLLEKFNSSSNKVVQWEIEIQERLKNANNISIEKLVQLIKEDNPVDYNQIRVLKETEKRVPYYFVNHNSISLNREEVDYTLYLFPDTKNKFRDLTKNSTHGIDNLRRIDEPFSFTENEANIRKRRVNRYKNLPVKRTERNISRNQPVFYDPQNIDVHTCYECRGSKYLHCTNCDGQHRIPCQTCRRQGFVKCSSCTGRGDKVCKKCSGKGTIIKEGKSEICKRSFFSEMGLDNEGCEGSGRVQCRKCDGTGRLECSNCGGDTYTECSYCHGDPNNRETYGRVDCAQCNASGEVGEFKTISSEILNHNGTYIISQKSILPDTNSVAKYIRDNQSRTQSMHEVYFAVNEQRDVKHSKTSSQLSKTINQSNSVQVDNYPMLLKENIYFQGIPVFDIKFKHILTNKTHSLSIVNFDKNPSIIYHSNFKEPIEYVSNFQNLLGRAFFKKDYIAKVNKLNEIVLMIYMAKADGVIEEVEKEIIENRIENISSFTKEEQEFVFGLMDSDNLPELEAKYTVFSTDDVERDVKRQLIKLIAEADGEYESGEKIMFSKIEQLIEKNRGKRLNAITAFFTTWQISLPILVLIGLISFLIISNL